MADTDGNYKRKDENKSIKRSVFDELFRPDIHFTITNADKLDMTPEEFEEMMQKSARSIKNLRLGNPEVEYIPMDSKA